MAIEICDDYIAVSEAGSRRGTVEDGRPAAISTLMLQRVRNHARLKLPVRKLERHRTLY